MPHKIITRMSAHKAEVFTMPIKEYYKILELSESADIAELNEHYRNKIKLFHPDLFAGDPDKQKKATEKTKEINLAYSELKKIIAKRPPAKKIQDEPDEITPKNNDSFNQFDIFGTISNLFSKLINIAEPRNTTNTEYTADNSKKMPQNRSQFSEVLKNKMGTAQVKKPPVTSYTKTFKELQKKRALYGNRQKDGKNEKGPISPISAVQGIKSNRIQ